MQEQSQMDDCDDADCCRNRGSKRGLLSVPALVGAAVVALVLLGGIALAVTGGGGGTSAGEPGQSVAQTPTPRTPTPVSQTTPTSTRTVTATQTETGPTETETRQRPRLSDVYQADFVAGLTTNERAFLRDVLRTHDRWMSPPYRITEQEGATVMRYPPNVSSAATLQREVTTFAMSASRTVGESYRNDTRPVWETGDIVFLGVDRQGAATQFLVARWWLLDHQFGDLSDAQFRERVNGTIALRGKQTSVANASAFESELNRLALVESANATRIGRTVRLSYTTTAPNRSAFTDELLSVANLYGALEASGNWDTAALDVTVADDGETSAHYHVKDEWAAQLVDDRMSREGFLARVQGTLVQADDLAPK